VLDGRSGYLEGRRRFGRSVGILERNVPLRLRWIIVSHRSLRGINGSVFDVTE